MRILLGLRYVLIQIRSHSVLLFSIIFTINIFCLAYELDSSVPLLVITLLILLVLKPPVTRYIIVVLAVIGSTVIYNRTSFFDSASVGLYEQIKVECKEFEGIIIKEPVRSHDSIKYKMSAQNLCGISQSKSVNLVLSTSLSNIGKVGNKAIFTIPDHSMNMSEDYENYLRRSGFVDHLYIERIEFSSTTKERVFLLLWDRISLTKQSISNKIESMIVEPYASLWKGIIFGDDQLFSDDMENAFMITQTTHVIAASGFNISIVMSLFEVVSNKFLGVKSRVVISSIPGLIICMLANISGSIIRAYLMFCVSSMARIFGVQYRPIEALLYVTVLLSIFGFRPYYNYGYILSAVAIIGSVLLSPILHDLFRVGGDGTMGKILSSISCSIAILPTTSFLFGSGSMLGVVSNFFLTDLVELIFYFGWITPFASGVFRRILLFAQGSILYIFIWIIDLFTMLFTYDFISKYVDPLLIIGAVVLLSFGLLKRLMQMSELYLLHYFDV